jgi:predicted Zn-dependent peptidase
LGNFTSADMQSDISWQREVLANGSTVLSYPRAEGKTAQLSVVVKYGSDDDSEANLGTAHFLEHMLAGGSKARINLHKQIENIGGISSFESSPEFTLCTADVLPGKLGEAARALSGLLFDSVFEPEKLDIERKVILNEIAEVEDDPSDKAHETLIKCLFKNHPIRNPTLGIRKTVKEISMKDIETAYQDHYSSVNLVLILTGTFTPRDKEETLNEFRDREKGKIFQRISCVEESEPENERVSKRAGINQAYLSFGARTAPTAHTDTPALDIIDTLLGNGESSRLFVELREKNALTYYFETMNATGSDFGFFAVNCAVKTKALGKTRAIIERQLLDVKEGKLTEDELQRCKNLVIADLLRGMDSNQALPELLAGEEIQFRNGYSLCNYRDRITSLTIGDVISAANKHFQEDDYATSIVVPKD